MYAAIWRRLPGPSWLKVVEATALALAVIAVLFVWVFPAIAEHLQLFGTTVLEP